MSSLSERARALGDQARRVRKQARKVAEEVNRNLANARAEAENTARSLGLPMEQGRVIDLGTQPSALRRVGSAVAAAALAMLIAGSLLSFTSFLFQFLLATLIASKILGLNLDLESFGQRVRG